LDYEEAHEEGGESIPSRTGGLALKVKTSIMGLGNLAQDKVYSWQRKQQGELRTHKKSSRPFKITGGKKERGRQKGGPGQPGYEKKKKKGRKRIWVLENSQTMEAD